LSLLHFSSFGIGVSAVVADHDHSLIGNMGGVSGDAGITAHRIAAVEMPLEDILDYRTEISVILLKTGVIFPRKLLEIIKETSLPIMCKGFSFNCSLGH
jgi:hypothetical protein